jgi:uncharacterized protein (DUF1684 family)
MVREAISGGSHGGRLFFIFRDETNGTETYGAGRFLYADRPNGGSVILDFNKAINPPCAFTAFATCPLPPPRTACGCASKPARWRRRLSDEIRRQECT